MSTLTNKTILVTGAGNGSDLHSKERVTGEFFDDDFIFTTPWADV